jgi:hypothetical protein
MQFIVKGSTILLFATDKKWDIVNIKLKAVTAQGIFFDAGCPALVIDQTAQKPIRLGDAEEVFEAAGRDVSYDRLKKVYEWSTSRCRDVPFILDIVRKETLALCGDRVTLFEKRFLDLFFEYHIESSKRYHRLAGDESGDFWKDHARKMCNSLMPIPQAWFYCHDPLEPHTFIPENAFRVDFAFWSGEKFYAVEIDGNEPEGYAADVRRDRLLRRAGIDVIHVLNSEIMQHGVSLIKALMPGAIIPGPAGGSGELPFSIPF